MLELPILNALSKGAGDGTEISEMLKFRVDNVANWWRPQFFPITDKPATVKIDMADFDKQVTNIAPLAQHAWFEYIVNPIYVENQHMIQACLVKVRRDITTDRDKNRFWDIIKQSKFPEDYQNVRWWLTAQGFAMVNHGSVEVGNYLKHLLVTHDGTLISMWSTDEAYNHIREEAVVIDEPIIVALCSMSFLHCKNVQTTEIHPTRQVRRATQRAGNPVHVFKILNIGPISGSRAAMQPTDPTGQTRAMHIARGHFRVYTQDKPLFGKHVGRFFIPAHVRGNKDIGTVEKIYNPKPV